MNYLKNFFASLFLLIFFASLTGCIIFSSPDSDETIVLKPGDTKVFSVNATGLPYPIPNFVSYGWNNYYQVGWINFWSFSPLRSEIGERMVECRVRVSKISVNPPSPVYFDETIRWNVEVWGINGLPVRNVLSPGETVLLDTEIWPTDAYKYEWNINGAVVNGAALKSLEFTPDYNLPENSVEVKASGAEMSDSYVWKFYRPMLTLGGSGWDSVKTILHTVDGGYIIAGSSSSTDIPGTVNHGSVDFYIIKMDADNKIEWQKMYGGSGYDSVKAIQPTKDGGYIVAGYYESGEISGLSDGVYIVKLDKDGGIEWQKMHDDIISITSSRYAIYQTSDGGYLAINKNIIKLNSDGEILWEKSSGCDNIISSDQALDGGYVMNCANDTEDGCCDYSVYKLTENGDIERQIQGQSGSIQQCSDGGYLYVGNSRTLVDKFYGNNSDALLVKTDADGNRLWQNSYGGRKSDWAKAVRETSDGGYIVIGSSESPDIPGLVNYGESDWYVFKVNFLGLIQWQKMFGSIQMDSLDSILRLPDDTYTLAGTIDSDIFVLRVDSDGNAK